MLVTTTNLTLTDPLLRSNTGIYIFMNQANGEETDQVAKTAHLTNEQTQYLAKDLKLGQCIIRNANRFGEPLLGTFEPLTINKNITPAEWETAKARILQYIPAEPTIQPVGTPTSKENMTPAMEPPSKPTLILSQKEDRLLRVVCSELLTVTEAFQKAGIAAQPGTNAKKRLIALGLIAAETITVRSGRGNKGVILLPTPKAYELLGLKPGKGTRGGDSPSHQFLVRSLAKLIPASSVEMLFRDPRKNSDKNADLGFIYNENMHRPFLATIKTLSHDDTLALSEGQSVAVECEISTPEKTGPENASRNAAMGVSMTILCVPPGHVERTAQALQGPHKPQAVVIVDSYQLLDALRSAYAPTATALRQRGSTQ